MTPAFFILTKQDPKIGFTFDYAFSYVKILRIEITKLIGKQPNDWYKDLNELSLLFTYIDKSNKRTAFPVDLASQIRLDQLNPIIQLNDFVVPEENRGNMTSLGNYVTELIIELKCRDIKEELAEVKIYYDITQGVRESNFLTNENV